jgi:hypothetical protein
VTPASWRIDELEDDVAVVEVAGRRYDVPRAILPRGARTDQCFRVEIERGDASATVRIALDAAATAAARDRASSLLARLRRRDGDG